MKLGDQTSHFNPNADTSTRLKNQVPVSYTFQSKDASEGLGQPGGNGGGVTIEQVINIFNTYITNTRIAQLLDVDHLVDNAPAGSLFVMGSDGIWTYESPYAYTLMPATAILLGGVKIGANINVTEDGTISTDDPYGYWTIKNIVGSSIKYGYLYNWYAATNSTNGRSIAPVGWHVPSNDEWLALAEYIEPGFDELVNTIGGKLKEIGYTYWNSPNIGDTNEYGFNSRGSGYRDGEGASALCYGLKELAQYWTSDDFDGTEYGEAVGITYNNALISITIGGVQQVPNKTYGLSLRFIKNDSDNTGTVSDFDGNIYSTVKIGTQVWTAQDYMCKHYNNGDLIPYVTDSEEWFALITGAMCSYDNDESNVAYYGTNIYSHDVLNLIAGSGIAIDLSGLNVTISASNGNIPLDNILHWDGTQYIAYENKLSLDPEFAYFYHSGVWPTYTNSLFLDGQLTASCLRARVGLGNLHPAFQFSTESDGIVMFYANVGDTEKVSFFQTLNYSQRKIYLTSSWNDSSVTVPIHIGGLDNTSTQYINIDSNSSLFEINTSNILLTKGVPSKWLALDANKNIIYMDAPGGSYTHPTQTGISLTLNGSTVLASLTVNTLGHTTNATTRTLTLSDLGYDNSNVVHISGTETITGVKSLSSQLNALNIVANSSSSGITILGTSNYVGIQGVGVGVTGYGIVGQASAIPISAMTLDTASNTIKTCLALEADSAHTSVADEYGLQMDYNMPWLGNSNNYKAGSVACIWTDVTHSSEDSRFEWWLRSAGTMVKMATLSSVGDLTIEGNLYANNTQQNVYTITLDNDVSVATRCSDAVDGVDYPTGWTLGAYIGNPNDIEIVHNLDRRIVYVTVYTVSGTSERQLLGNAAYSGIIAPDKNTLIIEGLATIATDIVIHLVFD
jgi:uncharacterized protein (TIGR02145 family)